MSEKQEQELHIVIGNDGTPKITAVGFQGDACLMATKEFTDLLSSGGDVETTLSPEYFETGGNGAQALVETE